MENTRNKDLKKVQELYQCIDGINGEILILTHNNPDPDGLASAFGLQYILSGLWKKNSTAAYGGMIGRAENKAMVKLLNMGIRPASELRFGDFRTIALIDSQPGTGNNSLPEDRRPNIIIDHHFPISEESSRAEYIDIRTDCGSTSSVITEYLKDLGLTEVDRDVATALTYGIRSDTRDFGREAGPKDVTANNYLYPWVNLKLLSKIEYPKLTREYFRMFSRAIERALIDGDVVISDLQEISNTDTLSEMADLLIRIEGVKWVLCTGEFRGLTYFSLRAGSRSIHAGLLAKKIVNGIGSGGGHHVMAAGKISPTEKMKSYLEVSEFLKNRFLHEIGRVNFRGKPL